MVKEIIHWLNKKLASIVVDETDPPKNVSGYEKIEENKYRVNYEDGTYINVATFPPELINEIKNIRDKKDN